VNYGPWSYFYHIAITCLLYSHCLLYLHTLLFSTRYAHNFYFKQTGEIDNLIASWERSTWLCCVEVPRCYWPKMSQQVSLNGALVGVLLSQSASPSVVCLSSPRTIKLWFLNWGKTSCYTHHTFLLGFPMGWSFTMHKDHLLRINLALAASFLAPLPGRK
jgi:hypothetical protein